jgi:hypothetical protein
MRKRRVWKTMNTIHEQDEITTIPNTSLPQKSAGLLGEEWEVVPSPTPIHTSPIFGYLTWARQLIKTWMTSETPSHS